MSRSPRVVVIGAGFGGLGAARALRARGVDDVVVLERAEAVGGVWRDNTYPGAACDVPSALYSWSWAQHPGWSRRYSPQPEILAYLRDAAEREGLLGLVRTGQEVTEVTWTGQPRAWRVRTASGATYEADAVVSAVGQLSNPAVPDLPGLHDFAGVSFHSARWRHDVDLGGRRVAVVGTGASAIQLVPAIVDEVASLALFQRSAPYVVPKPDGPRSAPYRWLLGRLPGLREAVRDGVFDLTEVLNGALAGEKAYAGALMAAIRAAWRLQLHTQVRDPRLRAALVPDYPLGCKRLLFSSEWYPALTRRHVAVVTDRVEGVEAAGVRTADGTLHEADVLIWGTGFAATRFLAGIEVTGPDGADLHRVWADGATAHLGVAVPGFPHLFCIYGPNTNLGGSSIIAMMEAQADYVAQLLAAGPDPLVVRADVAAAYDEEMQARLRDSVWASCTSWYRDGARITTNWPGQVQEYQSRLARPDRAEYERWPAATGRAAGARA